MNLLALLLLGGITAFCAAIYLFAVTLTEARPFFPPGSQDDPASRYALDTFIWDRPVPASARRKYVLALVCASAAVGCIALLMAIHRSWLSAGLFGVVFLFMAVVALSRWAKYRAAS
ncbi:MAG: hypothetical protein AB1490_11005 [Pseudomonadota bacterium]